MNASYEKVVSLRPDSPIKLSPRKLSFREETSTPPKKQIELQIEQLDQVLQVVFSNNRLIIFYIKRVANILIPINNLNVVMNSPKKSMRRQSVEICNKYGKGESTKSIFRNFRDFKNLKVFKFLKLEGLKVMKSLIDNCALNILY